MLPSSALTRSVFVAALGPAGIVYIPGTDAEHDGFPKPFERLRKYGMLTVRARYVYKACWTRSGQSY
jgi:hypothetical protein